MRTLLILLLAGVVLSAQTVSLRGRDWSTLGTVNVRATTEADGVGIQLPVWPNNLGYVWTSIQGPLSGSFHIALRVEMTGAPVFRWDTEPENTCYGTPPTVRPFFGKFARVGKKVMATADCWWSNPTAFVLGGSSWSADIPLDPKLWSGVSGQWAVNDIQTWQDDVVGVQFVGVTFGGGCWYSHGVGVENGTANVVITQMEVL